MFRVVYFIDGDSSLSTNRNSSTSCHGLNRTIRATFHRIALSALSLRGLNNLNSFFVSEGRTVTVFH